ncbi:MAG: MAE_28990/MAE_18760 family HEPN-like nuclease [Desulfitobacteriaceae bacterium]
MLMLYNLVEACVVSGMMEIYEHLKNNQNSYSDLIEEIRVIWSNYEIGKTYSSQAGKSAYEKRVQAIIEQVVTSQPIVLNREALGISGNLDARIIKKLCDKHRIRYIASDDDGCLKTVKDKRNNLAHGDESFGDCARDMTLNDLEHIKDEVVKFIKAILDGMKEYYDNKVFAS